MSVIVLGWDGLDGELADRYGVADAFGGDGLRAIKTLVNEPIGKPHTWELWPSIITGLPPDEHGIHAEAFIAGGGFDSRLLNVAARASAGVVPEAIRWRVGRWLRDRGAGFDFKTLDYYREQGIPTVLDGDGRVGIGIPNARTYIDDTLGIEADRGALLADYLESAGDSSVRSTTVGARVLRARVEADMARKLGAVRAYRDAPIVFVWLAYLDTLGHVAPTVDDPEAWLAAAYRTAAAYTRFIRESVGPGDTVICVSDHGLQHGQHTERAYIGAWRASAVASTESVLDVADAIEAVARPAATRETANVGETGVVADRLRELGYIE